MTFDLDADIALLEKNGRIVTAEHPVAQARFQAVPARRQRTGHIAHVLVVHEQHRAQAVRFHAFARALGAVGAQPVPVDALLPVETGYAEIRHLSFSRSVIDVEAVCYGCLDWGYPGGYLPSAQIIAPRGSYSVSMLASLMIFAKRWFSASQNFLKSAGDLLRTTGTPPSSRRFTTSGCFIVFCEMSKSLSTTGRGVPLGT